MSGLKNAAYIFFNSRYGSNTVVQTPPHKLSSRHQVWRRVLEEILCARFASRTVQRIFLSHTKFFHWCVEYFYGERSPGVSLDKVIDALTCGTRNDGTYKLSYQLNDV